jgi:vacuolar-type H+-ATPase subunit I/STV1
LGKYIKAKYVRAFWMIAIYKKYPQRIVNDPITPPLRKWMMVFLTLGVVSIPFAFLWQFLWWFVLANWGLVFLSTLPFTVRTLVRDPVVGLVAPWIMILRSAVFVVGFAAGFCAYMSKRDFDEVFYQKVE